MKNLHQSVLYWSLAALAVILAVFLVVSIDQKLNTATTTNTVSFSGEGKVLAKPDVAVVDFSIVTEAVVSKSAQDANSEKSGKVTEFLKKQKIEDKDIKTTSYNVYPQYEYPRYGGVPRIKGYQVSQTIEVKIRNLENVSSVLDGVVTAGANQVGNLNFKIDDPEKLKAEARAKAIADAKKKAGELKDQVGIKLGKIVNFSEGVTDYLVPMYESSVLGKGGGVGGGVVPSVPSGENEITVDVTITYQIK